MANVWFQVVHLVWFISQIWKVYCYLTI